MPSGSRGSLWKALEAPLIQLRRTSGLLCARNLSLGYVLVMPGSGVTVTFSIPFSSDDRASSCVGVQSCAQTAYQY